MDSYEFLRDLAYILFFAKFLSVAVRHFGGPEVVGEILAGLLIGPAILGLVKTDDFLAHIAEIGVVMLMFEAGLGTNMQKLKETGAKATAIACFGVFVPIICGCLLYMTFFGFGPIGSPSFMEGLFIGTIMAATSVSITVASLKELGKLNGLLGTTITSAAIIDDVIGIIVLTFVIGMKNSDTNTLWIILKAIAFFIFAIGTGYVIFKIFKWLDDHFTHTRRIPIVALCYCFMMAYVSEHYFGIADITGAYVSGIVLCNLFDASYIERRVDISAYMFFAPVFFANIGLKTSFSDMNSQLLMFSLAFVAVALLSKIIGCGFVSRLCKFNLHESLIIGVGMMTRGEVALITAQKGLDAGFITADFFTPVILLILVSSISVPIIMKKMFSQTEKLEHD